MAYCSMNTKTDLTMLVSRMELAADEVETALSELPNYGGECHEDHDETVKLIHEGNFDEIHTFCCECGGYKV